MEVVASVLGSLAAEAARILCRSIFWNVRNTFKFQSNLNALEREMRILIDQRKGINEELEKADKEGKLPNPEVKEWLREVEGIEHEVNSMQADRAGNSGEFCGYCLNCYLHYKRSQKVAEWRKELKRLMRVGSFPAGLVAVSNQVKIVEHMPGPFVESQATPYKNLAQVMDILNDDEVRSIGIWGMGGVGKTTLVKNLNNKLKSNSLKQPFSIVIWATVSKDTDLRSVQIQIAERLQVKLEASVERMAIQLYQRLEKEKKFLLILDDVWEKIDLDSLGVPQPEIHMGSKIILTSRSLEVCREMKTDVEVKVDILNDEEAWQLFTKNAGKVASLEHIKPYAEAVAKECNGLPLAIITVGAAMRGKAMAELWKDALNELQRSEPYCKGIEIQVYKPLKWSYDSLHGKNIKPCFLYCSLFPEDFSIKVSQLAQCWLAEGLIDEQLNHEDSLNRAISVVENLKDLCLLEPGIREGTVKMHDVVRDVAIWIASSLQDGCKSLVRSGIGLSQISDIELLKSCKRISFMNNKITTLPDCVIQCPNTSTLLLQDNFRLQKVPGNFLLGFQALRVLNMSGTQMQSLPNSLSQLSELCALVLRDCSDLKELPPLGRLGKLQVLDLHGTRIRELPKGMEELSNLRQLDLSWTWRLETIQAGVVSRLSSLEVLDMSGSTYQWGVNGEVEEGQAMFEELECLERLIVLYIWLRNLPSPHSGYRTWIERLRRFQIFVGSFTRREFILPKWVERHVILGGLDLSEKPIRWLLVNAGNLILCSCTNIGWMFEYLVTESEGFACLKSLIISNCDSLEPFRGCAAQHDLLPNLELLYLWSINDMECVQPLVAPLGLRFSRLKLISVSGCQKLKYLIPHGLIPYLENLEEIKVSHCFNLEKLFEYGSGQNMAPDPAVPKLRILELKILPELRTICRQNESWQSLEHVEVYYCEQLRRLPLTTQNANTIKEIKGGQQWWSKLEWGDDQTKLTLLPFFIPCGM